MTQWANMLTGAIGVAMFMGFVIGLSHSISTGFAGFWGGLPFAIIVAIVVGLALFNFWEETFRSRR